MIMKSKKKILIIIGKLTIGGAEKVGRDIGFYADKDVFEIHYLVFGDEIGIYEKELEEKDCRIIHMPPPSTDYKAYYKNIKELIKQEKYDVVHAHTMFNSGWAMMAAQACGVPVRIAHSHSIRGPEKRGAVKNTYEKTMRKLILHYATHLVACGQSAGEWLFGKKAFKARGLLIYNGIGFDEFSYNKNTRNAIREKFGLTDKYVIGHVGHLATVKNQAFLIGIMPEILKNRSDAVLLLLGEGNDRDMLQQKAAELGLEKHVIMTGNVSNVGEFMSAMDVFAFPSLYEGMPLAMVEAQTNGLPCIISDRIPNDVHLTDLVTALPVENSEELWIKELCNAERDNPEMYADKMRDMGFDTKGMTSAVYEIYRGVDNET